MSDVVHEGLIDVLAVRVEDARAFGDGRSVVSATTVFIRNIHEVSFDFQVFEGGKVLGRPTEALRPLLVRLHGLKLGIVVHHRALLIDRMQPQLFRRRLSIRPASFTKILFLYLRE